MKSKSAIFLAGFLVVWSPPAFAQQAIDLFTPGISLQKVVTPLYSTNKELLAIVRVEHVFLDYERHGFFKIGTMPVAVLDGVEIEVRDPQRLAAALSQLETTLKPRNSSRLEIRRLAISLAKENRIQAGLAKVSEEGRWELTQNVSWDADSRKIEAPQASLQVTGLSAGQFILQTTPPTTNNFFPATAALSTP